MFQQNDHSAGGGSDPAFLVSQPQRRDLPVGFSRAGRLLRNLYARPSSALGTTLVVVFLFMALFGPLIAPYSATEQIAGAARQPPSAQHLFGADHLGRDVFSRVVLGARDILALAGLGTLIAVVIGTAIGMVSAWRGGWADEVTFRLFDSLLALPALLLALLLLGAVGPSRRGVLVVLVVVYTPIVARVVRGVVLSTKPKGYVEAARIQGEGTASILRRDLFPAVLPVLSVEAALRFSYAIFLVASLGFLGVGVQPPSPDWGLMVSQARPYVSLTPWALYFPAAAIALLVIGINLAADGLKRAVLPDRQAF